MRSRLAARIKLLVALGSLVGIFTLTPAQLISASAAAGGNSQNATPTAVTAATFSLAPVLTTGSANPGAPLSIAIAKKSSVLFYLKNFGDLDLKSFTLSQSGSGTNTVDIKICAGGTTGGTFATTTTCANTGVLTTVLSGTSGSSINYTLSILVGATRQLSATDTSATNGVTNTVNVAVARSDARAATVTNS